MDSERLGAIVEEAKEYGHWDIVKRVSGNYTLFDGGRVVAEFGEAVYDAQFILDAIHALPQLHQQVQDLQAKVEQLEEEKRRLQIFLDEANDFMVNDSNQAKILDQLKEQVQLLKGIKIT